MGRDRALSWAVAAAAASVAGALTLFIVARLIDTLTDHADRLVRIEKRLERLDRACGRRCGDPVDNLLTPPLPYNPSPPNP